MTTLTDEQRVALTWAISEARRKSIMGIAADLESLLNQPDHSGDGGEKIPPIFYNGDTKRDPVFRERANAFAKNASTSSPIGDRIETASGLLETLSLENQRLRVDAERYRWLRDLSEPGICAFYLSVGKAFDGVKFKRETVDEAIDAQILASRNAEGPQTDKEQS
jgi:hypothetical protein